MGNKFTWDVISYILLSLLPVSLSVSGKIAGRAVSLAALLAVVAVSLWPSLDLNGCQNFKLLNL